jgi:hypothetical protein
LKNVSSIINAKLNVFINDAIDLNLKKKMLALKRAVGFFYLHYESDVIHLIRLSSTQTAYEPKP